MFGRSDLPPPPSGAVPSEQETRAHPWRRWLPIAVVSLILLVGFGLYAGVGDDDVRNGVRFCTVVDMGPLTGWEDAVTVVELDAKGVYAQAPTGQTMYAWGIDDAVWVASTDNPDKGASIWPSSAQGTVVLPVNKAAREYDPVTGTDVRPVIQAGFADAMVEAEGALAGCG
jgi:hypothetical protein